MKAIYSFDPSEDVAKQLYEKKIAQENEKKRMELEQKKQEEVKTDKADVEQALSAANYVIERIRLPKLELPEVKQL